MAGKKKSGNGALRFILLLLFGGMLVLGIFLVLNRSKGKQQTTEENMVLSRVQELTTMNLDATYPSNERELVTFFGRSMQVLYNDEVTDQQIEEVAEKLLQVYDFEFIGNQGNYPARLHAEVKRKKQDGITIQNYVVVEKSRVQYFKDEAGYECAGVECTFSVRQGTILESTIYVFICRKEPDSGKWKIFGWTPREDQSVNLFGW